MRSLTIVLVQLYRKGCNPVGIVKGRCSLSCYRTCVLKDKKCVVSLSGAEYSPGIHQRKVDKDGAYLRKCGGRQV